MKIVGLAILVAITGCKKPDTAAQAAPLPPLVTISDPEVRDVMTYMTTTGRTRAVASVEVRARVVGFLEEMKYEPGQMVKEGDLLFVIEKEDYAAQVEQAEAQLAATNADQEKAKSDLERFEEALKSNAVSKVQVTQARAELLRAEAAIVGAKANLRRANLSLSYCEVKSPIAGLVSRNLVDVGNLVAPDSKDAALLATVVAIQPIYCYFEIPEAFVNEALRRRAERAKAERDGKPRDVVVEIALPDDTEFAHSGLLDTVDNKVDTATGTLEARAVFKNEDTLLYSGVYVRVRTELGVQKGAVLVEEASLGMDLGGRFILVVGENNIVERRGVKLGQLEGKMRVILDGIKAGDRYVSDGIIRARPGLPVREDTAAAAQ